MIIRIRVLDDSKYVQASIGSLPPTQLLSHLIELVIVYMDYKQTHSCSLGFSLHSIKRDSINGTILLLCHLVSNHGIQIKCRYLKFRGTSKNDSISFSHKSICCVIYERKSLLQQRNTSL